jgi:hypothetical protein
MFTEAAGMPYERCPQCLTEFWPRFYLFLIPRELTTPSRVQIPLQSNTGSGEYPEHIIINGDSEALIVSGLKTLHVDKAYVHTFELDL